MSALLYLIAGTVFTYVVVYYVWFRAARCTWSGTLSGKTAIVTGNKSHLYDPVKKVTFSHASCKHEKRLKKDKLFPMEFKFLHTDTRKRG